MQASRARGASAMQDPHRLHKIRIDHARAMQTLCKRKPHAGVMQVHRKSSASTVQKLQRQTKSSLHAMQAQCEQAMGAKQTQHRRTMACTTGRRWGDLHPPSSSSPPSAPIAPAGPLRPPSCDIMFFRCTRLSGPICERMPGSSSCGQAIGEAC
eukprot:331392-Chlamydomonas_euryale.AAC.9